MSIASGPASAAGAAGSSVPPAFADYVSRMATALSNGWNSTSWRIYDSERRDMSSTYFSGEAWPSAAEACAASRAPPAFAKIYQLLFYKHLFHSDCQPVMTANEKLWHLAQSWAHYSGFIEACIEGGAVTAFVLPPGWAYDVVNEFLDKFQRFHEQRHERECQRVIIERSDDEALVAEAKGLYRADPALDSALEGVWEPHAVLGLLRRAVDASGVQAQLELAHTSGPREAFASWAVPEMLRLVGVYSLACLVRAESKVGDYAAAVEAGRLLTPEVAAEFVQVTDAELLVFRHLGFSLAMLGRFAEAGAIVSRALMLVHRSSQLLARESTASRFMQTTAERMLALLALCESLSPGAAADELTRKKVMLKYETERAAVAAGGDEADDSVEKLFGVAVPTCIDASWPPVRTLGDDISDLSLEAPPSELVAEAQKGLFMALAQRRCEMLSGTRSLLLLYTTIDVPKLARLARKDEDTTRANLMGLKLQAWRPVDGSAAASTHAADCSTAATVPSASDALHFVVGGADGNMVSASETRVARDTTRALLDHTVALNKLRFSAAGGV